MHERGLGVVGGGRPFVETYLGLSAFWAAYGGFHYNLEVGFSEFKADHNIRNTPFKSEFEVWKSEEARPPQVCS